MSKEKIHCKTAGLKVSLDDIHQELLYAKRSESEGHAEREVRIDELELVASTLIDAQVEEEMAPVETEFDAAINKLMESLKQTLLQGGKELELKVYF